MLFIVRRIFASVCPNYKIPRIADDVQWAEVVSRDGFLRNLCEELKGAAQRVESMPSHHRSWGKPRYVYAVVNDADSTGAGFLHYAAVMFRVDVDPDDSV